MHIRSDTAQVIEGLLVAYVSRAYDLLDLSGDEELLELCRQVVRAVWDVEIANYEDEHCGRRVQRYRAGTRF